ncbi:SDR family oxidoreductase, partial [Cryobacterium sp. Y50]|uniref:SDR family oxidoreductase n=1 Tax=Cryobacterium sp. Y50 TaxID=2048286 RepID=UPI0011B0E7DB
APPLALFGTNGGSEPHDRVALTASNTHQPRFRRFWIEDAPQKRSTTPDEVSPEVVFLASDAASFMSDTVIIVDGGGGYTLF